VIPEDAMLTLLLQPATLISLVTLTLMEIVLGIDNIVFIAILVGRLPPPRQAGTRRIGLLLALVMRLGLLFSITWVMRLTAPLFGILGRGFSGRDLILIAGGLFLLAKASIEIYDRLEGVPTEHLPAAGRATVGWTLGQIVLLDIVFSLDSVITAVGLAAQVVVMVIAMVAAVGFMLVFAGAIGDFVNRHPSMKILALSFLILIGVLLIVEGMGQHVSRGYAYFAMAFSLGVELLNMRLRKKQQPVTLHSRYEVTGG
jgi:predicted tellurium resistance membrane protein TerC